MYTRESDKIIYEAINLDVTLCGRRSNVYWRESDKEIYEARAKGKIILGLLYIYKI